MNKFFKFLYVVMMSICIAPIVMVSAIWDTIVAIANKGSVKECWKDIGRAAVNTCKVMYDFVKND